MPDFINEESQCCNTFDKSLTPNSGSEDRLGNGLNSFAATYHKIPIHLAKQPQGPTLPIYPNILESTVSIAQLMTIKQNFCRSSLTFEAIS